MNWLKKGPELKLPKLSQLRGSGSKLSGPKLKAPDFLVDLYWDLRDRHLLPLVALAIVAIVAAPFLLGGDSPPEEATPTTGASIGSEPVSSAKLTVVEAKPGLRDYRKRLRAQQPVDPFEQRYTAPVLDGTELGGGGEGSSAGETSTSVTKTSTSTSKTTTKTTNAEGETTVTTTTDDAPGGASPEEIVLFSFAIDVKVMRIATKADGGKEKTPIHHQRVLAPAALPSEKQQVVTYMGISPKSQKPLLLISDDVTAIYGEGECLSGSDTCQLLEVELGLPVTFVYGPGDVRYKITILDVEPVVAGKAPGPGE